MVGRTDRGDEMFMVMANRSAQMAADLDYVPVPPGLVAQVRKTWVSSITSQGKPVWSEK